MGTLSEVRSASEVAIAVKFLVLLKVKFCLRKVKVKFLALIKKQKNPQDYRRHSEKIFNFRENLIREIE